MPRRRTGIALINEIRGKGFPATAWDATDSNGVRLTPEAIYKNNEKRCELIRGLQHNESKIVERVEEVAAADLGEFREVDFEELCVKTFGDEYASFGGFYEFFYLKVVSEGKAEPVNIPVPRVGEAASFCWVSVRSTPQLLRSSSARPPLCIRRLARSRPHCFRLAFTLSNTHC